jgi:hypothetical protein
MNSKFITVIVLSMLVIASAVAVVSAQTSVGVKKGDWIEYQVTVTGNPPADHDIVWARMEVTGVLGEAISLDIQTEFSNGTNFPESITLNLATGVLGDDFIIPQNLNIGDTFHDQYQGTITITNVTRLTVAGAERAVMSGSTPETTYNWDRQTGILVDANSSYPEYSMATKTSGTNMWQPQILGVDPIVTYVLVTAVLTVVVVVAIFVWGRKTNP